MPRWGGDQELMAMGPIRPTGAITAVQADRGLDPLRCSSHEAGRSDVARPKSSDAVYLKIAAALRDRIREGDLKPGDKLPSEAAVSVEFGVARGTAREALKQLETDGL